MIQQLNNGKATNYTTSDDASGEQFAAPSAIEAKSDRLGGRLPNSKVLGTQRHNCASSNTSLARMSRDAIRALAAEIARVLFGPMSADDILRTITAKKELLALPILLGKAKGAAGHLHEFTGELSSSSLSSKIDELRQFTASGPERARILQHVAEVAGKALDDIHGQLERLLAAAPELIVNMVPEIMKELGGRQRIQQSSDHVRELETLKRRIGEIAQSQREIPSYLNKRVEDRLAAKTSEVVNKVAENLLGDLCAEALSREIRRAEGKLRQVENRATVVIGHRRAVLGIYENGDAGDKRQATGREIMLPVPDQQELLSRALATRGVVDVRELATAYRPELGELMSLNTPEQAAAFAHRLIKLVGDDCANQSVYDLLNAPSDAEDLLQRMYYLAHPHAELRMTSEELGVLLSLNAQLELPEADTPARKEKRDAIIRAVKALAGDICKVVDRPADTPVIRLCRMVAGYPSVCDSSQDFLQAAHQTLATISNHDPFEFDSKATEAEKANS